MNSSQHPSLPERPVTLLIAALGGEGGGMLADWIVAAAVSCDYPVQSTSVPGAAQRTGATTYYVEIYPAPTTQLDGRMPVMALTPTPGMVDIVAASELVEAGRALQNAYVSADRTLLVASTHRVYSVAEKSIPGDGRVDGDKIANALRAGARQAMLFDMAQLARDSKTLINAVLFGAIAGSGVLPLPRAACEQAIRNAGKGADASLRGFAAGYAHAAGQVVPAAEAMPVETPVVHMHRRFPPETYAVLDAAIARLTDYQDAAYAELFLDRLTPVLAIDREAGGMDDGYQLTCETARQLARWMSFEDLIRVADLKTRKGRIARVRNEIGAAPDDPVMITEYLKPGLDEFCSILTPRMAERLRRWAKDNGKEASLTKPMHLKTSTVSGFLLLRAISWLKPWRKHTSRYQEEHALMERWLGAIKRLGFAVMDAELALEIALCAQLVRGYGETHRTGVKNFIKIFDGIIESGTEPNPKKLADAIRRARKAAMGNPDAKATSPLAADPGKPIFWMPRQAPEKSGCA